MVRPEISFRWENDHHPRGRHDARRVRTRLLYADAVPWPCQRCELFAVGPPASILSPINQDYTSVRSSSSQVDQGPASSAVSNGERECQRGGGGSNPFHFAPK